MGGVTIHKPGEYEHKDESYEERQLRLRQERRARMDEHTARQKAFLGSGDESPAEEEKAEEPSAQDEDKQAAGAPENKAATKSKKAASKGGAS